MSVFYKMSIDGEKKYLKELAGTGNRKIVKFIYNENINMETIIKVRSMLYCKMNDIVEIISK